MTSRRIARLDLAALTVATALLLSCSAGSIEESTSRHVPVDVSVTARGVRVVGLAAETAALTPSDAPSPLRWRFTSLSGGTSVAAGIVNDPRRARMEVFGPDLTREEATTAAGTVTVKLPPTPGRITIVDTNNTVLGEANFDPSVTGASTFLTGDQILGEPVAIVKNGEGKRFLNVLIVGDGYTRDEMEAFRDDARKAAEGLASMPGYTEYFHAFNIYRQDIASAESGITVPPGRVINTAFNTSFGDGVRDARICVWPRGDRATDALEAMHQLGRKVDADVIYLIANTTLGGGCALAHIGMATGTRAQDSYRSFAHELGHAVFKLGDEYTGGTQCSAGMPTAPNVAFHSDNIPWRDMMTTSEVPTSDASPHGTIGAFQGSGTCAENKGYRPQSTCLMQGLKHDLCKVCRREIQRYFQGHDFKSSTGDSTDDCFTFQETGKSICGKVAEFWRKNGGLPVFGLPKAEASWQLVEGKKLWTQWFERNRIELHPENPAPYDVELGRMGDDQLRQLGIDWFDASKTSPSAPEFMRASFVAEDFVGQKDGCQWFEQTRHYVCDSKPGLGFNTYWKTHRMDAPGVSAHAASLRLFGLPLSRMYPQTIASPEGIKTIQVQWFERARFEWHDYIPDPKYKVLLGLLGNELMEKR